MFKSVSLKSEGCLLASFWNPLVFPLLSMCYPILAFVFAGSFPSVSLSVSNSNFYKDSVIQMYLIKSHTNDFILTQ